MTTILIFISLAAATLAWVPAIRMTLKDRQGQAEEDTATHATHH